MKKYADNLMRFLEGISSRLSQLELYCYNLDKTIGEMRSDLVRDHVDADLKLKSIEKHLQEVSTTEHPTFSEKVDFINQLVIRFTTNNLSHTFGFFFL